MDKSITCEEIGKKISIELLVLVFTFTSRNHGKIRFDYKKEYVNTASALKKFQKQ